MEINYVQKGLINMTRLTKAIQIAAQLVFKWYHYSNFTVFTDLSLINTCAEEPCNSV